MAQVVLIPPLLPLGTSMESAGSGWSSTRHRNGAGRGRNEASYIAHGRIQGACLGFFRRDRLKYVEQYRNTL